MLSPQELLTQSFKAALEAVMPEHILPVHLPAPPEHGRLVVVGAGKAAASMARVTEQYYAEHYPHVALEGVVVTRYGHSVSTEVIEVLEASHPTPDEAGHHAATRILDLTHTLTEDDVLLCLISGGGSALLTASQGISLARKTDLTRALLKSGASIQEMNTVRKHLSRIKGGQLVAGVNGARVLSLIISDVAGDDLSSVASGPTLPDPTSYRDALEIIRRYALDFADVQAHFERGVRGEIPDTPTANHAGFKRVENRLIASAQQMLEQAAAFFAAQGVVPVILTQSLTGEAREAAAFHAALAAQVMQYQQPAKAPCVLLSGGETTVTVRGSGRGGRNSEFLLALALELGGLEGVYALAADTDGIDGVEDNAGALITPTTLTSSLDAQAHLDNNDAYSFFHAQNALVMTGPTLTNVNDYRAILCLKKG